MKLEQKIKQRRNFLDCAGVVKMVRRSVTYLGATAQYRTLITDY